MSRLRCGQPSNVARAMVPALGVTTIFYLLEKARGAAFAGEGVERLIRVFNVAPVDDDVVRRALAFAWSDFEDAVCAAAPKPAIATRSSHPIRAGTERTSACD